MSKTYRASDLGRIEGDAKRFWRDAKASKKARKAYAKANKSRREDRKVIWN